MRNKLNSSQFKSVAIVAVVIGFVYLLSTLKNLFGKSQTDLIAEEENKEFINGPLLTESDGSKLKMSVAQIISCANDIYDSISILFGVRYGSEEKLFSAYGRIETASDGWRVAQYFKDIHGITLKDWLQLNCSVNQLNQIKKLSESWETI